MLDIKFIRENKDLVAMASKKKHIKFDVEELLALDDKRREILVRVEEKRAEQNRQSEKFSCIERDDRRKLIAEQLRAVKSGLEEEETKLKEIMQKWQALMLAVPNIPDISVPEGASDKDNVEIRTWGEKPVFDFEPKNHIELMEKAGMVDILRGGDVSGFRGYFLVGGGAMLSFALWKFAFERFLKKGFTPFFVPSMVRRQTLLGTGYLPGGEDDLYKTQDNDYLAGTAEVATMSYFGDTLLKQSELPKKIISFSPCFRREAGSYGKDEKGLFRVHEFFKWEQVILCEASHEKSVAFHEELTKNSEELLQELGIPYRVVINCGGDLGQGQVKKYDIECWHPSEKRYRETHSSSYFHDFQSRRLNIKYKDAAGKNCFVHSLNNTALATPRLLISIIENNQQKDGSINLPRPLQEFFGSDRILPRK